MKVDGKNIQKVSGVGLNQNELKKAKLKEASENFEAIFLNLLLKSTIKISPSEDGLISGGDVLDGIFYLELSKHIAKSGKFGIAELVYKQLSKEATELGNSEVKYVSNSQSSINTEKRKFLTGYGGSLIDRMKRFDDLIRKASEEFNVPEELIKAIIAVESSGNVFAISSKGAKGLMQLVDSTAKFVGIKNVWHPAENIYGGVKYLRYLLDRFNGDVKLALAGYNAGPENVEKYGGVPPFPETIEYIGKVTRYLKLFEQSKIQKADAK